MRIAIIAAVALVAGCATPEMRDANARMEAAYRASPDFQADLSCQTKVQFAMAGHRARNILDLEGMAKANQMHASCMDYWRRTGQMP